MCQGVDIIAERANLSKLDLFSIHARDLIWTWLQESTFLSFPSFLFQVDWTFFIHSFANELVSQLVCQGSLDQFSDLCKRLECNEKSALSRYMGLITVYSTIRRNDGQVFDSSNFLIRELGLEKYNAFLEEHDLVTIAFSCLDDAADAPRILIKLQYFEAAKSLSALNEMVGVTSLTMSRKPLQLSLKQLFSLYLQSDASQRLLDIPAVSLLTITRNLLRSIITGLSVHKEQATRRLLFLKCLYRHHWTRGYLPLVLLRGFSSILLIGNDNKSATICHLLLDVLCEMIPVVEDKDAYRTVFESTIILIWAAETADVDISLLKQALREADHHHISKDGFDLTNLTILCDFESPRKSPEIAEKLTKLICHANTVFLAGDEAYSSEPKEKFINLVSQSVTPAMLQSLELRIALRSLVPAKYVPANVSQATLLSRLDATLFLHQVHGNRARQGHDQHYSPGSSRQQLLEHVLESLSSYKPNVAECAEQTLSQCISTCDSYQIFPEELLTCLKPPRTYEFNPSSQTSDIIEIANTSPYTKSLFTFSCVLLTQLKDDFCSRMLKLAVLSHQFGLRFITHLVILTLEHAHCSQEDICSTVADWLNDCFARHEIISRDHIYTGLHILKTIRNRSHSTGQLDILQAKIDYLMIAKASLFHHRSCDAIMYIHIAWTTSPDIVSTNFALVGQLHESLGEPDSIYGVPAEANIYSALRGAEYRKEHHKTLAFYSSIQAADLRRNAAVVSTASDKVSASLASLGLDGLNLALQRTNGRTQESEFRSAWRLGQWNIPFTRHDAGPQQLLYRLLCSLSRIRLQGDESFKKDLRHMRLESCLDRESDHQQPLHAAILFEVEEAFSQSNLSSESKNSFLDMWSNRTPNLYAAFS